GDRRPYRFSDCEQVALGVLAPGGLDTIRLADSTLRLQAGHVVVLELDAAPFELLNRGRHILDLESHLCVLAIRLSAAHEDQEARSSGDFIHESPRSIRAGRFEAQLFLIPALCAIQILGGQRRNRSSVHTRTSGATITPG